MIMQDKPVALVTGANKGIGLQIAKDLAARGFTVLVGSRNLERGEAPAKSVGADARAIQLDVTDQASIAAAAERNRWLGVTFCPAGMTEIFRLTASNRL
jgi:NAD(P)-dependent dehydrogenase (short-subunit alcohol dehydrogenase family)